MATVIRSDIVVPTRAGEKGKKSECSPPKKSLPPRWNADYSLRATLVKEAGRQKGYERREQAAQGARQRRLPPSGDALISVAGPSLGLPCELLEVRLELIADATECGQASLFWTLH